MTTYNGHKNWNHWNVSLWLNNDEWLHNLMIRQVRNSRNRTDAANQVLQALLDMGITHTADGARYSKSAIRSAMFGL